MPHFVGYHSYRHGYGNHQTPDKNHFLAQKSVRIYQSPRYYPSNFPLLNLADFVRNCVLQCSVYSIIRPIIPKGIFITVTATTRISFPYVISLVICITTLWFPYSAIVRCNWISGPICTHNACTVSAESVINRWRLGIVNGRERTIERRLCTIGRPCNCI